MGSVPILYIGSRYQPGIVRYMPGLTNPLPYYQKILTTQPAALYGWRLGEASGRIAAEVNNKQSASVDMMLNGGFETAGAGGADIWAYWAENAGDGAISDEVTLVHGGSHAAKLTAGANANTRINQSGATYTLTVVPGESLTLSFWTRGDGTNAGRYAVLDETHSVFIRTLVTTGVTGTTYTQVNYAFTIPAGCYSLRIDFWCPAANGGIAYFDDVTLTGARSLAAIYSASGVTYGQTGIGDGTLSAQFNGTNTYVQPNGAAFNAIWNGDKGSAIAWGKLAAAQWQAQAVYRYPFHVKSREDTTVYCTFGRSTVANTLSWRRRVTGSSNEQTYLFNDPPLDWFAMGYAWDISVPVLRGYLQSSKSGWLKVFDIPGASMNSMAAYHFDDGNVTWYSGSTSSQNWIGYGAHVYYWPGIILTDSEFQQAMSL